MMRHMPLAEGWLGWPGARRYAEVVHEMAAASRRPIVAGEPDGGPGTQVVLPRAANREGPLIGSPASAARRLRAMPFVRAGEAASEFTNVASVDQLARGGVTAWRHGPVIAGCAAAPYPPPRVLAPEPLKLGILVVPASAGGHRVSQQAAGGRPPGCGRGWARAGVASGLNAAGAAASPARSPGPAVPSRPGSRICGTAHGRTGRRRRSCPAEARRARRRAGRSGKTGMLPTETCSRALALHAPIPPGRSRFTGTACERRPVPRQRRQDRRAAETQPVTANQASSRPARTTRQPSAGEPGFNGAGRVSAGTMPASSHSARPSAGDGIRQLLSWRRPSAAPHKGHYGDIVVSGAAEPVMESPPAGIAGLVTRARLAVPGYRRPPTPG